MSEKRIDFCYHEIDKVGCKCLNASHSPGIKRRKGIAMTCMENLLDALAKCGEAAVFYKGQNIVHANRLFADLFEKDLDECEGLPVVEICHEESIEMIRDFIRRRAHGDSDVPTTYPALFRTAHNPKLRLQITVIRTENTEGAYLAIIQKIEPA